MEWKDEGIVLSARRHGETSLILEVLTKQHGRHAGYVRGGSGKKVSGDYQAGNYLKVTWRSRIEEQLGNYSCELIRSNTVKIMYSKDKLACLLSACAVSETTLPERETVHLAYDALEALIDVLVLSESNNKLWQILYVRWELNLLAELGFGLDFTNCAATGATDNLVYVSPKSGRAVSADAGKPYHDKLLPLPSFLLQKEMINEIEDVEILNGLRLTGYFLNRYVFNANNKKTPSARTRFINSLTKY